MTELWPPIRDNLLGYDMLIILVALGTAIYLRFVLRHADMIYRKMHTRGYLPDDVYESETAAPLAISDIKRLKDDLRRMRETSEKYYSMFITLSGVFPFMGILGTVIALIPLVQHMDNMQQNFYVALTSTLWGLIFAIIFRVLDGVLSPKIDRNNRGIDDYLDKLELKLVELKRPAEGVLS